ncbi:hypothetical protein EJ02DRAFT_452898 [Clathrospora elynae]|uniref:MARVEL domain-containing protein n=1 Tax=Clathrospora elynae TaxID=706981 RepID=A0A6A5SUF5_9PLEO|nr:hypothetical protein EJ02DRAFT_452898 [Clathrospora elynae]
MPFPFALPRDASPRLRILQLCQLSIAGLTILATFFAAVIPQKSKAFTFSLLYSLIFTSMTTTFLVYKEQKCAAAGTLSKEKYVRYQLFKIAGAFGMSVVGFIAYVITSPIGDDKHRQGEQGLWLNGHKVGKWQSLILWMNFFNWVFLWAGLFYSCCMTGNKQGPIALAGDEAQIGFEDETADDEAVDRNLQAQDRY